MQLNLLDFEVILRSQLYSPLYYKIELYESSIAQF